MRTAVYRECSKLKTQTELAESKTRDSMFDFGAIKRFKEKQYCLLWLDIYYLIIYNN